MTKTFLNPETERLFQNAVEGYTRFLGLSEKGLKSLAEYGWFIDGRFTLANTSELMEKAINQDIEYIDNYFTTYYRANLEKSAEIILRRRDSRSDIIHEALECHKLKKYHASTILFLSQSDGICNGQLFLTSNKKKPLKKYLAKSKSGVFMDIIYRMITDENSIDAGYKNQKKFKVTLNRQNIVHGRDVSYGTEINSLKAFSLLSFVSDFVDRFQEQ